MLPPVLPPSRPFRAFVLAASSMALVSLFGGCASSGDGESSASASRTGSLGTRWTAPEFATRIVAAERAAVLDAAVSSAHSLGYAVNRIDSALGRVFAARRQTSAFDGARQDTLEITVTTLAPGSTQVALNLRETFESTGGDERSGGVTTSRVRDRAPYDAFFDRLAEALAPTS